MANRNFANSRIYSGHVMPVLLDASISIGASGAVSSFTGPYIKSVERLSEGVYQIQAQDNYSRYYFGACQIISPVTAAAAIDPNAGVVGSIYRITIVGDTDWETAGVPAGVTPAVDVSFVLAAAPAAGTGRVKLVGQSGLMSAELIGNPNLMSAPMDSNLGGAQGAIVILQCLEPQIGAAVTQGSVLQFAPADPANGSILKISMMFSNSSILIQGE